MLHFFYSFSQLPTIDIAGASNFELLSAAKFRDKVIPFSHLYVTSNPYFRKIRDSLPDIDKAKLKTMNEAQVQAVESHQYFPMELNSLGQDVVGSIKSQSSTKQVVNIVVVNGIGSGFGDNYVGLGAMQRLQSLLAPIKVNFHLMQRMDKRVAPVYMREPNIFLLNNCLPLKQFFAMDYFVNLTGMLGFLEFDELPLVRFMGKSFGVNEQSSVEQLQPKLRLDELKKQSLAYMLKMQFPSHDERPLVLFHPQASSPVRSIKKSIADPIISALIAYGFNVISAIPYGFKADEFFSADEFSSNIDDLLHITACCDAVISVGTVLYHLSAALNKPTILLPSVRADLESGKALPQVTPWLPDDSKDLILDKHKSRKEEDMAIAEQIWGNINPEELAKALMAMLKSRQND